MTLGTRYGKGQRARNVIWFILIVSALIGLVFIAARTYERDVPSDGSPRDERLVWIGSKTVLANPEQLGQEMADWYDSSEEGPLAFELSDYTFVPASAELSSVGKSRANEIAELLNAHPSVAARIVIPTRVPDSRNISLDQKRALGMQRAIVSHGPDGTRVMVQSEVENLPTANSSEIVIYLSK